MANINFDQFEREIQRAESYLSQAPNRATTPQDDNETLFFASDITQQPNAAAVNHRPDDAMLLFGSARETNDAEKHADAPSYNDDSLMHTLRFGASRDSDVRSEDRSTLNQSDYKHDRETLFYASDVLATGGVNYENEEEMSFLPSPSTTPRESLSQNKQPSRNKFSESMADTVRFTKPIEPSVRSMEQSTTSHILAHSNRPPIVKSAVRKPKKLNSKAGSNQDEERKASAPRKFTPRAPSPAKFVRRIPTGSTSTEQPPTKQRSVSAMSMERIEELHRTRLVRQQEMLKQKRALDELQLAECTFKPDISRGTRVILHQKAQFEQLDADLRQGQGADENIDYDSLNNENAQENNAMHVSERLFREAEIRQAQSKWIKQQVTILRDSQYTYQPMINPVPHHTSSSSGRKGDSWGGSSGVSAHVPIHERIAEMMRQKREKLADLRASLEDAEVDLTFKPKIDAKSRRMATEALMGYGGNPNLPQPQRSSSPAGRQIASQPQQHQYQHTQHNTQHHTEPQQYGSQPPQSSSSRDAVGSSSNTSSSSGGGAVAGRTMAPSARPSTAPAASAGSTRNRAEISKSQVSGGGSGARARTGLTGEQEATLVLGFYENVADRLMNKGRKIAENKQKLVHERDNELAARMEQAGMSKRSERIVQTSGLKETFEERQAQYRERERKRREEQLQEQAQVTNQWFRPTIGAKSEEIVSKQRPEILLESAEQKMERLSVKNAQNIEEKRRRRAAELYGAIPFTPSIDPVSRMLGRSSSIEDLVQNRRGWEVRERIRRRVEEEENQECTFRPQINELSKQLLEPTDDDLFLQRYNKEYASVGWAQAQGSADCPLVSIDQSIRDSVQRAANGRINMQEPELMARNIRLHLLEKEEKRRTELITREIEELKDCTFRPSIESSLASLERQRQDTSPVVIRGLGRYLELKHLTAKQKEDALQREKEVFSVKNVDKYRRPEDGSTVVQSFNFSLVEPRQHSRLDISSGADEIVPGSLNASTLMSHTSHRHATSPASAAAWCV